MYALQAPDGSLARSERTGELFQYGTYQLAHTAARILGKSHRVSYRVVKA